MSGRFKQLVSSLLDDASSVVRQSLSNAQATLTSCNKVIRSSSPGLRWRASASAFTIAFVTILLTDSSKKLNQVYLNWRNSLFY